MSKELTFHRNVNKNKHEIFNFINEKQEVKISCFSKLQFIYNIQIGLSFCRAIGIDLKIVHILSKPLISSR